MRVFCIKAADVVWFDLEVMQKTISGSRSHLRKSAEDGFDNDDPRVTQNRRKINSGCPKITSDFSPPSRKLLQISKRPYMSPKQSRAYIDDANLARRKLLLPVSGRHFGK